MNVVINDLQAMYGQSLIKTGEMRHLEQENKWLKGAAFGFLLIALAYEYWH